MKKLAQKSAVSIVKFQPPLPEVIRQSREVQRLKKEKSGLIKSFSMLMKAPAAERDQGWATAAMILVDQGKEWTRQSKKTFEPWRAEAFAAHRLVTSTMDFFTADVESLSRAAEGARVAAVLKSQADMRLRQANLDADAEKANAQRPEEEQAPAALVAPEIEGSTGRKIWCADRHKFDLMDYLLWFVVTAPRSIYSVPAVVPDWAALDAFAKSGRDTALLPGFNFGHKIAGTDLFIPNPVKK